MKIKFEIDFKVWAIPTLIMLGISLWLFIN